MLGRLFLLFVTVPLVELALLVWVGERVGLLATVALVVVTGAVGAALARHQGLRTLDRFQEAIAAGRLPHAELVEGLLVLVAGAFLVTPGLLTDSAGFLLLVPALRQRAARRLSAWLERRFYLAGAAGAPAAPPPGGDVVDAEYTVVEEADDPASHGR